MMRDVVCGECGEPWEYYYLTHELTEDEKEDVLRGNGCQACSWGSSDRATGEYQLERVQSIQQNTDLDPVKYANL
jgi:type II secretory ATPase GspE/PulE/Tfp pilus assembly ATPase PilB-like protein